MAIYLHSEITSFNFLNKRKIKNWLASVAVAEGKNPGNLNFIVVDDLKLAKINLKYLRRKTLTDVIAFDYCVGNTLNGDIYISADRVKENAVLFHNSFHVELSRVMIHGLLHLVGYDDHNKEQKERMRQKEDHYLKSAI